MRIIIYICLLGLLPLFNRCIISDDFIRNTELGQDIKSEYIKKGNVVISNYKDSIYSKKLYDENGYYYIKSKWSIKNGNWFIHKTSFYDKDFKLIKSTRNMASIQVNNFDRNYNLISVKYLNENNQLHNIEILGYAKWKRTKITDCTYVISYYTEDNNLRKGILGCKQFFKIDSIPTQIGDTIMVYAKTTIYKTENCK